MSDLLQAAIDENDDLIDDVDEVAEQLALQSIISEERHSEILERENECLNRLELLSNRISELPTTATESPAMAQILRELVEMRVEVTSLKSSLENLSMERIPSVSVVIPPPVNAPTGTESPMEEHAPLEPPATVEPEPPPPATRRKRFHVL